MLGRQAELAELDRLYNEDIFVCAVLHGRRRIGKSTLADAFCRGKKAIYFTASETTLHYNLMRLGRCVQAVFPPGNGCIPDFDSPDVFFNYLCEHATHERAVLVIDDFPAFGGGDHLFAETLASFLSGRLKETKLFILLCGATSAMVKFAADKEALFSAVIPVLPLDYYESARFSPHLIPSDRALLYGVTGGIPAYLAMYDADMTVRDFISAYYFEPRCFFLDEPSYILRQELREPAVYAAILEAVANGAEKLSELSAVLAIKTGMCATYIKPLLALGLLEKNTPLYGGDNRKTAYRIRELPMLFYFLFVAPHKSAICMGGGQQVLDKQVWPEMNMFMSVVFRRMAAEYLSRVHHYTDFGRWWGNETETGETPSFDPVASDTRTQRVLLAQCRYSDVHAGTEAIKKLMDSEKPGNIPDTVRYALFSKTGFTRQALNMPELLDALLLVDLNGMYSKGATEM